MSWIEATRARLRLLLARRAAESRMDEEFRFHVEMETERLVREQGLDSAEAKRRALIAFGGVEKHKEELRSDRGLAWLSGMSLDFRLGLRMLVKYPGLAVVGVLGLSVAVAIGAISFAIIYTLLDASLPLDGGERIIAIQSSDTRSGDEGHTHLHDLATWREGLQAVEMLGAYRTIDRNLITPQGRPEPVRIAEMSASGFRIARVPPLMGRYFSEDDEREGAPPVVVIGYDVWQSRFTAQPDIVGRTLQLGATPHEIIGVMPEGFAFPINNRIWTPLRLDPADYARGEAPRVDVFGRLATTATLHDAQTQLAIITQRLAASYPETYRHVQSRILPYPRAFLDSPQLAWAFHLIQVLISMLLVVIGTNVAVLVYARTMTRMGEIAVRSALGASRGRIVSQLFAEALVLSIAAAAVGLVGASVGLRQLDALLERLGGEQVPFWMTFNGISPGLILYVAGLAVIAAVIIGVVPALRATRRDVHANLQHIGTAGSAMQLGRTWTVLIVTQVAIAVGVMPVALSGLVEFVRLGVTQPGFATREFLTASLRLDREGVEGSGTTGDPAAFASRYADLRAELVRRLEADQGVADVVMMSAVPGDEPSVRIERERAPGVLDTTLGRGSAGFAVGVARVDADFFDAFDIPVLAGRGFVAGDAGAGATAVIVNRSFVERVLNGESPLGRRVRRAVPAGAGGAEPAPNAPWYEIVGVVPDYPALVNRKDLQPKLYQPLIPAIAAPAKRKIVRRFLEEMDGARAESDAGPVVLAVRVRGDAPSAFANRLRELTVAVDPMLRLGSVNALEATIHDNQALNRLIFAVVAFLTLSVLLLSAAGIYALMSFTITRRRREIGIRSALGAGSRQVLWSVLSRATGQIAIGIAIGILPWIVGATVEAVSGKEDGWRDALLVLGVAGLMAVVGILAAIGPARRALAIQPTEALRADG